MVERLQDGDEQIFYIYPAVLHGTSPNLSESKKATTIARRSGKRASRSQAGQLAGEWVRPPGLSKREQSRREDLSPSLISVSGLIKLLIVSVRPKGLI